MDAIWFQQALERAGASQADLARHLRLAPSAVSRMVKGERQMKLLEAVQIAVRRAGEQARGSVMASDAFSPFSDGLEEGIRAGITAAIQPGGSMKDSEVIAAADAAGIAMVVTGRRHFKH